MTVPRGKPPADAVAIEGLVPFHDVDPLHIVWHGHYYKYLEVARTELFRRHAIDGRDVLDLGYRFVVSQTECKHVGSLTYGDRYRVKAWFIDTEQRINVGYEVWDLTNDRRAARGRTELVTTDMEGTLLFETPAVIRDRIAGRVVASKES